MTGPDCAVICNLINTHTHTHTARVKEASPIRRPGIKYSSPAHCAHVKRPTRVQLPELQPTNARLTLGRGTAFLKNSGDCYKRHAARIGIGVCYKCGDLHTNLSRHLSGCDRTPSDTTPPHSDGLGGEPSARNPDTPSTPVGENVNQSEQSSPSILLLWGI